MNKMFTADFAEILTDFGSVVSFTDENGAFYPVKGTVAPILLENDLVPGGFRPRRAFKLTATLDQIKKLPEPGSPAKFNDEKFSVLSVTCTPGTPFVTVAFCERA